MLFQASITSLRHSLHTERCLRWYYRSQQHYHPWSEAFLCQSYHGSQMLKRLSYSKARIKLHSICQNCNALAMKEVNRNLTTCSQAFIHKDGGLNTQEKFNVKPEKEDLEKNERVNLGVIVEKETRKDSEVAHSERLSPLSKSDNIPSNRNDKCDSKVESEKLIVSSYTTELQPGKDVNSKIETPLLQSRVQHYFLWRYSQYLKKFQESLKNEMPDTFKMFHIFTVGIKEFIIDFKDFIKVLMLLSLPGWHLDSLSHHQLLLYHQMPWDMIRVFPVLLLSSLPFGQNIAFPIGYWFPRHLLCRHFWDIHQRHDFAVMALKKRLFNARPVFRSLQAVLSAIADAEQQENCKEVFFKLGSGIHPNTDEIISLIPLFRGDPFHIRTIWVNHVNGLLRLHGRSVWGLRRRRLEDHARMLHCMDKALVAEKLNSLTHDNLKTCLFVRGLNPTNMSTAAMLEYMENWLTVSQALDPSCYSLLLHLPIFLAYNQPSNILLIY